MKRNKMKNEILGRSQRAASRTQTVCASGRGGRRVWIRNVTGVLSLEGTFFGACEKSRPWPRPRPVPGRSAQTQLKRKTPTREESVQGGVTALQSKVTQDKHSVF